MQVKREFDRCRLQILKIRASLEAPDCPVRDIRRPAGMRQLTYESKLERLKHKQDQYFELERLMLGRLFR